MNVTKGVIMPAVKKVIKDNNFSGNGVVSDKVKDRGNDPYFVKKAEKAKEFLQKHPLTDDMKK
ncbi:MAG TPA: hypothetical protein VIM77_13645 [Mucilaginibacter sp.]